MKLPKKIQEAMQMQVEAERKKRAYILESEGQREADINVAEGQKKAKILNSEAFKLEQINNAEGTMYATKIQIGQFCDTIGVLVLIFKVKLFSIT